MIRRGPVELVDDLLGEHDLLAAIGRDGRSQMLKADLEGSRAQLPVEGIGRQFVGQLLGFQERLAASLAYAHLPRGPIHADLFRDNVMFDDSDAEAGDRLSGLFDFYFAGIDTFLFDIAVCVNDWCIDLDTGRLDEDRASALVCAYHAVRPLSSDEQRLFPSFLRGAALRFWISRLWDLHLPRDATMLTAHDPDHFERVLQQRSANPWRPTLPSAPPRDATPDAR
jgi:homoserine kinase type II